MTGTALTEANEFHEIYALEVVPVPTHRPMVRLDQNDQIYKTKEEKFAAAIEDIVERHDTGQPVLVGTISVEVSEHLSRLLERRGDPARGAERQEPRARGHHHRGRRAAGRGHDRHQHGRPRRRHQAGRRGARPGRPVRAGHRAARVAPDRQPAARPLRPPGGSGRDALLPVGPGRGRAPVRRRPHVQDPGQAGADRRRADRSQDAHQPDRARPEEGRGVPLRQPQERRQVRRRA